MKKTFFVFILSFVFIISSCTSLSELFSGKKEESNVEVPANTESESENPQISETNSKNDTNDNLIPETVISDLGKDESKVTIKDLVETIPVDFEEPLVRDLEPPVIDDQKLKNEIALTSDKEEIINDLNNNDLEKTVVSIPETNKTEKSQESSVRVEKSNSQPSITTVKTVPETAKTEKPVTISTNKTETKSSPVNVTDNNKSNISPEKTEISKPVNTVSDSEQKTIKPEKTEELSNLINNEKSASQENTDKIDNKTIPETTDNSSTITKGEDLTKTIEPPKTSAGTKTENKSAVIPSKPENKSVPKTETPSNNETKQAELPLKENKDDSKQYEGLIEAVSSQTEEDKLKPSRSVTLNKGETLIVEYPGSGWLYLGSDHEYNNLESKGRKAGNNKTTYILTALEPGTQIQHFYKTDSLSGNYIDDYIEVTVRDQKGSPSTEVYAPSYEEIVPKKPEKPAISSTKIAQPEITIPAEASKIEVPEKNKAGERSSIEYTPEDPEYNKTETYTEKYEAPVTKQSEPENAKTLLEQAKALYNEKKYNDALTTINTFLDYAINNRDSGLYLKGQILEADSSVKNIKGAIAAYNEIIKNYPASEHWDDANKRIIYLRRFYIEAR